MTEKQVTQWIENLADEHVEGREPARAWLLDHPDVSYPALSQLVEQGQPDQRTLEAIRLLGRMSRAEAVPLLAASLHGAEPQLLWQSAQALAQHTAPQALEVLLAALHSPNAEIVSAAAVALGVRGDEQARAAIEQLLSHPDEGVRYRAVYALRLLGVAPSAALLREHTQREASSQVRQLIDETLQAL